MKKLYLSLLVVMLLSACTCKLAQDNVVAVVEEDVVVVEETPTEEVVEEDVLVEEETEDEVVTEEVETKTVIKYSYKLTENKNVK